MRNEPAPLHDTSAQIVPRRRAPAPAPTPAVHGWLDGVMQGLQLEAAAQVARAQRLVESSTRQQPTASPGAESTPDRGSYL